jgi:DNA-3-methyladenine glycosylase I
VPEKKRCHWCEGDPLLERYHDQEWGIAPKSDNELFERMSLQIFQAGLNWKLILSKRANFLKSFDSFNLVKVAKYDDQKLQQLLNDPGILRNRRKIEAVIHNARVIKEIKLEYKSFQNYLDSLPDRLNIIQVELRKRFKFLGPEISRMFVMNIGKIAPPHERNCWRYQEKK